MIAVHELATSRPLTLSPTSPSVMRRYIITHSNDSVAVNAAVAAVAPALDLGFPLVEKKYEPQGGGVWIAEWTYGPRQSEDLDGQGDPAEPPEEPETPSETQQLPWEYSFDTGGNTQRITQSLDTRQKVGKAGGGMPPDYGRAIGVSKDGIAGCDIVVPKFEFSIQRTVRFITLGYLKTLRDLTGTTNNATAWRFLRGEVLFLGASGGYKGGEVGWSITYKFLTGKNRDEVVILPGEAPADPPLIRLTDVRGHDYIWVGYEDAIDSNTLIQRPKFAYVEQVYPEGNFRLLGIGGA